MKNITVSLVAVVLAAFLVGCGTTRDPNTKLTDKVDQFLPYIKPATVIACTVAIGSVKEADKVEIAKKIHLVSGVVATLAGGTTPTPEELKNAIIEFGPKAPSWVNMANSLKDIYELNFKKLNSDGKTAVLILQQISLGCKEATQSYMQ